MRICARRPISIPQNSDDDVSLDVDRGAKSFELHGYRRPDDQERDEARLFPVHIVGIIPEPGKAWRVGYTGNLTIDRRDWGIVDNRLTPAGVLLVGYRRHRAHRRSGDRQPEYALTAAWAGPRITSCSRLLQDAYARMRRDSSRTVAETAAEQARPTVPPYAW